MHYSQDLPPNLVRPASLIHLCSKDELVKKPLMTITAITILSILSACAHHSYEIQATDVSPNVYKGLSCKEIETEINSIINKITELVQNIDKTAEADEKQTTIGVILFDPLLFAFLVGDKPEAQQYAQLKGEFNALEHTAILKECSEAMKLAKAYRQLEHESRLAREKGKSIGSDLDKPNN